MSAIVKDHHRCYILLSLTLPLRHLIFYVVIIHVNFELQKEKKAVRHTVCTKLILITVVSHLSSDGTVLTEMYSTVKDIKIIMNMLIILFHIQNPTMVLYS